MKSNSSWWKACKLLFKRKELFCSRLVHNGKKTGINNREKADIKKNTLLANQPLGEPPGVEHKISNKISEPSEVYKILKNLDTNKATGPDGVSSKILKEVFGKKYL